MDNKKERFLKVLEGTVVSDKMDKTCVVSVPLVRLHPLYKKRYVVYKKYYVHDEENKASEGNIVSIVQFRPLSRKKRWMLKAVQS